MRAVDDQNCLTLVLDDRDVAQNLPELRWNVLNHVLAGRRAVLIDLAAVTALSSTAVATLLNMHRVLRARGGRLVLQRPSAATRDLLRHTGLNRVLDVEAVGPQHTVPATAEHAP